MKYQKMKNLFDNAPNQPFKFRTKNWVEINDESRAIYNTKAQVKFEAIILKLIKRQLQMLLQIIQIKK